MYKKEVWTTWALILQLGISMMVPIFLLVAFGIFIRDKLKIDIVLIAVLVGVAVGIRNDYVIIKSYLSFMRKNKKYET